MTPSDLKYKVECAGTSPYFFTRNTMQFFGDTMQNYGVRRSEVETWSARTVQVWELYRKRPVKHGLQESAYFNMRTFRRVNKKREA